MYLADSICRELAAGRQLALLSVLHRPDRGSEAADIRLLLTEDGLAAGSAPDWFPLDKALSLGRRVARAGLAECTTLDCDSGRQLRVFAEPLLPDNPTLVLFRRLAIAGGCGEDMFCLVPAAAPGQRRLCRRSSSSWPIPAELSGLVQPLLERPLHGAVALNDSRGQHFALEPWPAPWRVICAGAGPVSRAAASIASAADFSVAVVTDRDEAACRPHFPMSSVIREVPGFEASFQGLHPDERTFVLIESGSHESDTRLVHQALATRACLVLLAGGRESVRQILAGLREKDRQRVRTEPSCGRGDAAAEECAVALVACILTGRSRARKAAGCPDPLLSQS